MQQIKINVICLQFLQLAVEQTVKIIRGLDFPDRQLGCQHDPLAIAVLQSLADNHFTVATMVRVSGIDVADTPIDASPDHPDRLELID